MHKCIQYNLNKYASNNSIVQLKAKKIAYM